MLDKESPVTTSKTMLQNPPSTTPGNSGPLKYANPRDLPSYPSSGLRPDGAAASAAATLGWSNQKTIECWKPDKTSSASAAAALAKDYKAAPVWRPDASSSDGARAALLAAAGTVTSPSQELPPKNPHDGWGNSAASQAFNRSTSQRQLQESTASSSGGPRHGQRSLAAAQGAMSLTTKRRRAASTPSSAPTTESRSAESRAASNALSGATLAHQASIRAKQSASEIPGGATPVTTMTRNMFTSQPPVKPEVDEKQNKDKLHASAVAMARTMYAQQQKIVDQAKESQKEEGSAAQPKPYVNLQDAAYKQAQERLAKLQDEHQKQRDLNEYYGSASAPRRRFSISNKLRRRSSSEGAIDDQQQSQKIKQQMSLFSNKLTEVDQKKRQEDRDALLAAAQRNVKARLEVMDKKVLRETGQVNPSLSSDWESKAHQLAFASHESRNENKGKVDIGGGIFMDPAEVNAIASKRVQPVLDDIHEKAETERARLAVLKLDEEAKKAEMEKQKARQKELKELQKKIKDDENKEGKAKRAEEKAEKAEQKRFEKEQRKSAGEQPTVLIDNEADDHDHGRTEPNESPDLGVQDPMPTVDTEAENATSEHHTTHHAATSPTAKVKGWIKNRFSRGKSVGESDKKPGFIGGIAIREPEINHSTTSLEGRSTSMREVALAGRSSEAGGNEEAPVQVARSVSPMSSQDGNTETLGVAPPKPIKDIGARNSSSPSRDSRFREEMD